MRLWLDRAARWIDPARRFTRRLRRSGLRKTVNMLHVEWELRRRRTRLRSRPYYYFVDPCSYCNLRCPLCATGNGANELAPGMMSLRDYEAILDKIAPYAAEIALHRWGEPLLNPEIFALIAATRRRGIPPTLSSNLNVHIDRLGERLVESGLDRLIVSLDGATQDIYAQYRVRGDIDLALANVRAIVEAKRRLRRATPVVEWQFIVFRHNEHQLDAARALAKQLNVDRFRVVAPILPLMSYGLKSRPEQAILESSWLPRNAAFWQMHPGVLRRDGSLFRSACFHLYRSMTIAPGGGVSSCCMVYTRASDFGNLLRDDLDSIWNNSLYRASRALFTGKLVDRAGSVCDGCYLFKRPLPK